jgi:solute:Na+ symporter, SSS family
MNPHVTAIDLAVIAAYFLAVMALGLWLGGKDRSVAAFTTANRSLPGWLCGLSILATFVSSISFLGLPGKAFASNWNAFVFSLSLPLAAVIAVRFFLPFYRASGEVSAYSHLERRFGTWARLYAGIFYLLTQLARIGSVLYLMALPMHVLLGWEIHWIILFTGISVTIYTFVGGIVAVIWTDAIQAVVLTVGALLCALLLLYGVPGGPREVWAIATTHDKLSLGSLALNFAEPTFWVVLVYGLFINLQNFGIDQNYVQRYIAASSDREARKSLYLGGLIYVPLSGLFFVIGTGLFAYYQVHAQRLPAALQDPARSDSVFPHFIVTALPPGVTGLLLAAVFAAAMSTVSTSLNSSATLLLTDFFQRFRGKPATEKQSMKILYGSTIVWGVVGTAIALAMTRVRSVLDAWWTLSGIFSGGMLGLFLLGMMSRRAGNWAAVSGVVCGLGTILWMTFSPRLPDTLAPFRSPFHTFMTPVLGTLTILFVGVAVAQFVQKGQASELKRSREQEKAAP